MFLFLISNMQCTPAPRWLDHPYPSSSPCLRTIVSQITGHPPLVSSRTPAPAQSAPNTSLSKQRVDPPSCGAADVTALLLAEKHESNPSTLKMSEFSETLDLKSASGWDKFSLALCGVEFDRSTYTELRSLIKDPRWYDPTTETMIRGFVER